MKVNLTIDLNVEERKILASLSGKNGSLTHKDYRELIVKLFRMQVAESKKDCL